MAWLLLAVAALLTILTNGLDQRGYVNGRWVTADQRQTAIGVGWLLFWLLVIASFFL